MQQISWKHIPVNPCMFIAKPGNNLFNVNETTTNVKWLYAFFINNDWRKETEHRNVGFAQMMQIQKRTKPLDYDNLSYSHVLLCFAGIIRPQKHK